MRWAYNVSTPEVQTAFSPEGEHLALQHTPDDTYCALTLEFKNELTDENTKVYPASPTHGRFPGALHQPANPDSGFCHSATQPRVLRRRLWTL